MFSTLRSVGCRSRPLNLRLKLGLLCVIGLVGSQANFILALGTLFGCCLAADCRLSVWKVRVRCGSNCISRRRVEHLRNVRSLSKSNTIRSTCVLINAWFAESFVHTISNWRLCVQFWWAVLLINRRGTLISAWVDSALNMSRRSWYKTTSSFWAWFDILIIIPFIAGGLICLLNARWIAALLCRALLVSMTSLCLFSCTVFYWLPSRIQGLWWLLLLSLWRIFDVVDVFTKSISYLVIVLSLVLTMLLFIQDLWRSIFVIQWSLRYICRLLQLMRVIMCGRSVSVLSSRFSSIADSCVGLRLHCVWNCARRSAITRTLFYFWCCEFLKISYARFQSLYRRLLTSPWVTSTVLTTGACRVMSGACWTRSVVCISSSYTCSAAIRNTCRWLRIEVSWEAGCVVVLLYADWLRGGWKVLWALIQVIWIRIVHFL